MSKKTVWIEQGLFELLMPTARFWAAFVIICLPILGGSAAVCQELSRGNAILLEKGLQIQAMVTPRLAEPMNPVVGFDYSQWLTANFTTVNWQYHSEDAFELPSGAFPAEMLWGKWTGDKGLEGLEPTPHEAPYLSSLVSFQYRDEQDLSDPVEVDQAATWLAAARQIYPDVISYTNQFGGQLTTGEMQNYLSAARPDMVMFDRYPFNGQSSGPLRSPETYYSNLQTYRLLGLGGNDGTGSLPIPSGLYLQTFMIDGHSPSDSEMRLNQFSAWSFGYKFTIAFIYNSINYPGTPDGLYSSLFDGVGYANPTDRFYSLASINHESLNLAPALVRLQSTDVRFMPGDYRDNSGAVVANPVPAGLNPWAPGADPYITSIAAANLGPENDGEKGDVLVGYFKPLLESFDGPNVQDEIYFMIVNALVDPKMGANVAQDVYLTFDFGASGITSLERLNRETGEIEIVPLVSDGGSLYHLDLLLNGGSGDLFKFNTGAPFVVPEPASLCMMATSVFVLLALRGRCRSG